MAHVGRFLIVGKCGSFVGTCQHLYASWASSIAMLIVLGFLPFPDVLLLGFRRSLESVIALVACGLGCIAALSRVDVPRHLADTLPGTVVLSVVVLLSAV